MKNCLFQQKQMLLTYTDIGIEYGTPKSPYVVDHNTFGQSYQLSSFANIMDEWIKNRMKGRYKMDENFQVDEKLTSNIHEPKKKNARVLLRPHE